MAEFMLDFEKPIYELEAKLAEWEKLDAEQSMNFSDELKMLRKKIEETKKEVCFIRNLKRMLSRH